MKRKGAADDGEEKACGEKEHGLEDFFQTDALCFCWL